MIATAQSSDTSDLSIVLINTNVLKAPAPLESGVHWVNALIRAIHRCPNEHIVWDAEAVRGFAKFGDQILSDILRGVDFVLAGP